LAAHAELPGNPRKRISALQLGKGGQPPRLHGARVSSGTYGVVNHAPSIARKVRMSTYLYRNP
jgi:hypothetical protein